MRVRLLPPVPFMDEDELLARCLKGDVSFEEIEKLVDPNYANIEWCEPCQKEHGLRDMFLGDGEFVCLRHARIYGWLAE